MTDTGVTETTGEQEARWRQYVRGAPIAEMRPYELGEDLTNITVPINHVPSEGDMVARNPRDRSEQWLVPHAYFMENFEVAEAHGATIPPVEPDYTRTGTNPRESLIRRNEF